MLEEELEAARSVERVRLDADRVLFWLEDMAGKMDDDAILRLFVSRVILREDGGYDYFLRYNEFIPINTWEIQKLKTRVAELEARLGSQTEA